MNMHVPAYTDATALEDSHEAPRKSRVWLYGLLVLVALVAFVWFLVAKANAPKEAAPASSAPTVSVSIPGTTLVADRVAAVGDIYARRDMPVGVVGEGGMISAIRVEAGQYVAKGQVLAEIDSAVQRAQLAQMQASVSQAVADAKLAQSELERAEALVGRGFISKADIDRKTATRDSANARVTMARAQVRELQERLNRLAIRAPEAGLVLQRTVEPGQIVSPSSGALYRIAAGGLFEVRAKVAEQDLATLKVGQQATVSPAGSSQSFVGNIWLLEPAIDPQTRQGIARIALPQSSDIRDGGFANVVIEGAQAQRPQVPQSAILTDRQGPYVLVVDAQNIVRRADITPGTITPNGTIILSGLNGSEKVVQSAGAFLNVGEKVTPKLVTLKKPAAAKQADGNGTASQASASTAVAAS